MTEPGFGRASSSRPGGDRSGDRGAASGGAPPHRRIRNRNPHASPADALRILERRYLTAVTTGGAAVGATAMVPAVGTGTALALSGAETVGFLEATALFAQSVTELHGIALEDPERARTLVLALMVGGPRPGSAQAVRGTGDRRRADPIPVLGRTDHEEPAADGRGPDGGSDPPRLPAAPHRDADRIGCRADHPVRHWRGRRRRRQPVARTHDRPRGPGSLRTAARDVARRARDRRASPAADPQAEEGPRLGRTPDAEPRRDHARPQPSRPTRAARRRSAPADPDTRGSKAVPPRPTPTRAARRRFLPRQTPTRAPSRPPPARLARQRPSARRAGHASPCSRHRAATRHSRPTREHALAARPELSRVRSDRPDAPAQFADVPRPRSAPDVPRLALRSRMRRERDGRGRGARSGSTSGGGISRNPSSPRTISQCSRCTR